jgi:hypothetical protein
MTRRRDFLKKSVLGSAGIAVSSIGLSCKTNNSSEESQVINQAVGIGSVSLREIQKKVGDALEAVKVIDPHSHLDAAQPAARNLAEIVLYHHVWIELVSAGMGQYEVTRAGLPHELTDPQMDPMERVRKALPYLPRIRNTTVSMLLKWLLEVMYGVKSGLQASGLDSLAAEVDRRGKDPAWTERFFAEICKIEKAATVEKTGQKRFARLAGADERLRSLNIADGKSGPRERIQLMAGLLGRDVRTSADYRDYAAKLAVDPAMGSPLFIGAWMPGFFTDELADEKSVTRIIGKALNGEPLSQAEMGSVSYFGMVAALEALRKTKVRTIQLIVGAEVILPHRSVTQWNGNFSGAAARLASRFEDFRFNLGAASDAYTQDLAVLAKHIPNISVAGYWWHTMYPYYIRKSIETRLDIVPVNKIIAFFSDAYSCEWCYPKLRLVKQIMGEVLVDRVYRKMYDLDTALSIIPTVFYDAPKEIYGF